jgi:hypothetical protein
MYVGNDIDLTQCINLTSLPNILVVNGDLILDGCNELTVIEDGVMVKGMVSKVNCELLPKFGATSIVEKRLILATTTYEKNEEKIQFGLQSTSCHRSAQRKRNAGGIVRPI